MTDIFIRTRTNNPIRLAIAEACIGRLALFESVDVHLIAASGFRLPYPLEEPEARPRIIEIDPDGYHIESRSIAQRWATSDVYVVIDDDCMPIGKTWLRDGLAAMAAHPNFSALASWSINGEIDPAKCCNGDSGLGLSTAHPGIFEVPSLGTPTFIRRRRPDGEPVELNIPAGDLGQYDATLSQAYFEHGRIGMLRHVRHNHLGYGLSEVVPEWWLA